MLLSLKTLELCRTILGKDRFWGFEEIKEMDMNSVTEEMAESMYDELNESELLEEYGEAVQINALGQHIFSMMAEPEQFIKIENALDGICVRLYFRNTYYLCVFEEERFKTKDGHRAYKIELLPLLDHVVGAFVYALHRGEKTLPDQSVISEKMRQDIKVMGKAWSGEGEEFSRLHITGRYQKENICCQIHTGDYTEGQQVEWDTSTLVNTITKWLFSGFSESMKKWEAEEQEETED